MLAMKNAESSRCISLSEMWALGFILGQLMVIVVSEEFSLDKVIVDSAPDPAMFDFFHVMPSGKVEVMTEWDLLLSLDQYQALYYQPSRGKRKAVADINKRWKDCFVYYEITDSLDTKQDRDIIRKSIKEWEKFTCLDFKPSRSHSQRIQFKDGGGCYSKLGMQDEPQPLVLARGCRTLGTVVHEIGHAIGLIHEHMRPDRDSYVYINFNAIDKVHHDNYRKYLSNAINTYGIPYDYTSLMHYGNSVFPGSILALDAEYQDKIGQRQGLSFKDIKIVNLMYDCPKMFCHEKLDCGDGFQMPKRYKGMEKCLCWCDSGDLSDPLILCSERKTPPPPPQPSTMPTAMPDKVCKDVREDCPERKELGHCMTRMALMARACSKTCGFCDKEDKVCMDYDKGCPIIAAGGSCNKPGFEKKMEETCKASCDFCPKPPSPCDIQREMMGDDHLHGPNSCSRTSISVYSWLLSALLVVGCFGRYFLNNNLL